MSEKNPKTATSKTLVETAVDLGLGDAAVLEKWDEAALKSAVEALLEKDKVISKQSTDLGKQKDQIAKLKKVGREPKNADPALANTTTVKDLVANGSIKQAEAPKASVDETEEG